MARLVNINNIDVSSTNELVEVRGSINRIGVGFFHLLDLTKNFQLPEFLKCIYDKEVQFGYAKVIGNISFLERDQIKNLQRKFNPSKEYLKRLVLNVKTVQYITEEEAKEISYAESNRASFFNGANLSSVEFESSEEMLNFLNSHAMAEGFKLVHKKAFNEAYITFRCYLHSKYHKLNELNEDCKFKVSIGKGVNSKVYKVTSFIATHSHPLVPELFTHLIIQQPVLDLINTMLHSNIKLSQITTVIKSHYNVSLTSCQLRILCSKLKRKIVHSETQELHEYMFENGGQSFLFERKTKKGCIYRKAIATFSKSELQNLHDHGDFVSIDPTFTPQTMDWSVIPITLVNCERKIISGGIIFTSGNTGQVFKWILKLLTTILPCRDKIKTLCSDDDNGLQSGFNLIINSEVEINEEEDIDYDEQEVFEQDFTNDSSLEEQNAENLILKEKVGNLKRVICFWHKISNFTKYIQKLKMSEKEKEEAIHLFKQIGICRDAGHVNSIIERLCIMNKDIENYLLNNIVPKLEFISKAFLGKAFTCGYVTSSISESANSMLKSYVSTQTMDLISMRKAADKLHEQREANQSYIKKRKKHKMCDPSIYDIMLNLNISKEISEAIAGSINKVKRLTLEEEKGEVYNIYDMVNKENGEFDHQENFKVINGECSCNKFFQTGIPCSHLLKVLDHCHGTISKDLINPRWFIKSLDERKIDIPKIVEKFRFTDDSSESNLIKSVNGRYSYLMSLSQTVASLASKSQQSFLKTSKILTQMENDLKAPEDQIIDENGSKPGRKRYKRIK